jgi:hypothetical protein
MHKIILPSYSPLLRLLTRWKVAAIDLQCESDQRSQSCSLFDNRLVQRSQFGSMVLSNITLVYSLVYCRVNKQFNYLSAVYFKKIPGKERVYSLVVMHR